LADRSSPSRPAAGDDPRRGEPLLDISSLGVAYGDGSAEAVRDFDLQLRRGEAVGLVGESGAGKSTVALAVLGLLPHGTRLRGSIRFDGTDLVSRPDALRRIRWRKVSVVLQDSMNAFNPVMTVGEQIAEVFVVHEKAQWKDAVARARTLLERVELPGSVVRAYPHELSGGMRQRAALAMAVALSPDLVIVDEPTSALDVVTSAAIAEWLRSAGPELGAALLVISHDVSLVARTCTRAAVMQGGRIVEEGPVARLVNSPEHPYTRRLIDAVPRLPAAEGKA